MASRWFLCLVSASASSCRRSESDWWSCHSCLWSSPDYHRRWGSPPPDSGSPGRRQTDYYPVIGLDMRYADLLHRAGCRTWGMTLAPVVFDTLGSGRARASFGARSWFCRRPSLSYSACSWAAADSWWNTSKCAIVNKRNLFQRRGTITQVNSEVWRFSLPAIC